MFSEKDYNSFISKIEPIIIDTYEPNPSEEAIKNGKYFFQNGFWPATKDYIYFYDKSKINIHKKPLLSLCKKLPKFHNANDQHSGTISSFDLLPQIEILESQSPQETLQQMIFSEHFANLLCGSNIATIQPVSRGNNSAFLIILDKKYREFMEQEGKEPFDD